MRRSMPRSSRSWSPCCARRRNGPLSSARSMCGCGWRSNSLVLVMAGLVPALPGFWNTCKGGGGARGKPGHDGSLRQKNSRGDPRQFRDGPVVDIGPGVARAAVGECHGKHLPQIFRRLRKAVAAGLVHVELVQHRLAGVQAVELAMDDVGGIVRQHQARIVFYQIKPAAAVRLADEIGIGREQPRHRMVEAAHQGAVDEETVGDHEVSMSLRAQRSNLAMTDQAGVGTTSSVTTTNFVSVIRPKLVVSATSAASRPVAIRMRPMRSVLWRASKVYHWPER